jgi:hypothetical protein
VPGIVVVRSEREADSAAWLVAIAAGVLIIALVSFQAWFSLQLLSQNERMLGRLEALEASLAELAGTPGLALTGALAEPERFGQGLAGAGLPLGTPAPPFQLEGLDDKPWSLDSLLTPHRQLKVGVLCHGLRAVRDADTADRALATRASGTAWDRCPRERRPRAKPRQRDRTLA